jgi:molecular chaperone HscB
MNPFEFFGLQPAFQLDEALLRKLYLKNQKTWHPDFHTTNEESKEAALVQSSLNNEYYKQIQNSHSRVRTILQMNGRTEDAKNVLPQSFLMDMMELNDTIMEARMGDEGAEQTAREQLKELLENVDEKLKKSGEIADAYFSDNQMFSDDCLSEIQALYQQYKYLSRLEKNLNGVEEI